MTYMFNLKFNELDEELQNQKINEIITFKYENGTISQLDEVEKFSLEDALNDEAIRNDTRKSIEMHFPIYF